MNTKHLKIKAMALASRQDPQVLEILRVWVVAMRSGSRSGGLLFDDVFRHGTWHKSKTGGLQIPEHRQHCAKYHKGVPFELRVDRIFSW
jgi:hypothetical protein